jgi:hypothetical protein
VRVSLQPGPYRDSARTEGDSEYQNAQSDVDGDGGTLFHGLLLSWITNVTPDDFGTSMPRKSGEESIPSFQRTSGLGAAIPAAAELHVR